MDEADAELLRDMVEAARKAVSYTQGKSRGDLDTDELLALGLVRLDIVWEIIRDDLPLLIAELEAILLRESP